ncbi:mediator of RNA polymerase II transcription subunit 13-like [Uloborus diversus]|uniref:mediator of RNA polymerase II transcription subunit 13-like n=1 Tax=Uloborus diversus TaxID=327109 RepID=UPI00240A2026|nr:mediator of RNA polymerase II transcription subunit 13-like [Uloborus diversus]
MTHPNFVTNGASLEDCHTNFFALADLCGIKWRRYYAESLLCYDPLDDPVLSSFSKCSATDILCVWRRVASQGYDQHRNNLQDGSQLNYKKELWIFWYGEEPDLNGLVSAELTADPEQGSWENGLSYECRTLLFKALHNLIERSLLSKGFSRLGKWFVQPYDGNEKGIKSPQLSFAFHFFIHGESTVCASVDVRQRIAVCQLTRQHLSLAQGCHTGLKVILCPYGMAGTLTGQSYKETDITTQRLLSDWHHFYPLRSKNVKECVSDDDQIMSAVEVIVGGIKMRYPSSYVLVTEIDELSAIGQNSGVSQLSSFGASPSGFCASRQKASLLAGVLTPPTSPCDPSMTTSSNDRGRHSSSSHEPGENAAGSYSGYTTAWKVKEASWQDGALQGRRQTAEPGFWDFGDPSSLVGCNCSRCKGNASQEKSTLKVPTSSATAAVSTASPSASAGSPNCTATTTTAAGSATAVRKVERPDRARVPGRYRGAVPFHKRNAFSDGASEADGYSIASAFAMASVPGTQLPGSSGTNFQFKGLSQSLRSSTPSGLPQLHTSVVQPSSLGSPHPGTPLTDGPNSQSTEPAMPTLSPHPPSVKEEETTPMESQDPGVSTQSPAAETKETKEKIAADMVSSPYPNSNVNNVIENIKSEESPSSQNNCSNNNTNGNGWTPSTQEDIKPTVTLSTVPTTSAPSIPAHVLKRPSLIVCSHEDPRDELVMDGMLYDYAFLNTSVWESMSSKRRKLWLNRGVQLNNFDTQSLNGKDSLTQMQVDENLTSKPKDPYEFNDEFDEESPSSGFRIKVEEEDIKKEPGLPLTPESQSLTPGQISSAPLTPTQDPPKPPSNGEQQPVSSPLTPRNQGSSFTSEKDLQVTDRDLENIFETSSSDDSADDLFQAPSTPTSSKLCGTPEEPFSGKGKGNSFLSILGVAELTRMFPTPPSLEHNTAPSPSLCGSDLTTLDGSDCCRDKTDMDGGCSPYYEPVKDWSFVYKLPLQYKFIGSKRYAPLTTLSSQLQPLNLSTEHVYKPSWTNNAPSSTLPANNALPSSQMHTERLPANSNSQFSMMIVNEQGERMVPPMFSVEPPIDQRTLPVNYELQSPASSASSYLNKHLNSVDSSGTTSSIPEAHSLLVNLVIADSMLNLFKDHNFSSCTLCVCNMNTKGADAGINLPSSLIPSGTDEPQYKCTCGFSAVVNRHQSHRAGIFYEDELDITGHRYETFFGRKSLSLVESASSKKAEQSCEEEAANAQVDLVPHSVVDLIKVQCSHVCSTFSLFHKAEQFRSSDQCYLHCNALEMSDGCEVCFLALDTGRQAVDNINNNKMDESLKSSCLHKWPYLAAKVPVSNLEIVHLLRSLQPVLQEAVQQRRHQKLWEVTYPVLGPLTWRQFHRLAGRGTEDQCEPQPIPSLLVGYEKDWLALSPFALKYWDKLLLEPYTTSRDIAYVVVAPDSDFVLTHIKKFFKELSTIYELCKLGKHCPITKVLRDGIMRVGKSTAKKLADEPVDDWFSLIGDGPIANRLKLYAQACRYHLAPHLATQPLDSSLLESPPALKTPDKPPTAASPRTTSTGGENIDREPAFKTEPDSRPDSASANECAPSSTSSSSDSADSEDCQQTPTIVIYIVEPFTHGTADGDIYRLASLGLMRSYTHMLQFLPEHIKNNIHLQVVTLDSILRLGSMENSERRKDQLKALAFSVFSQCHQMFMHQTIAKSLTGFGPAAAQDIFVKSRDARHSVFSPPPSKAFTLAPQKDKQAELGEMFGDRREKSSILYCTYCLTEDQRWLVASCTDDKGDLLETCCISIEVPNRTRRKKASVRRFALHKLLDFIVEVLSKCLHAWRLVISRLGRLGHGELRDWATFLSRKSLLRYSRQLRELCHQCAVLGHPDAPAILSACLVSLEPDSTLRVMADQFTPDDRFSSSCNSCDLSTPEDASCTHILVFPTSSTAQSSQATFQAEQIETSTILGDDDDIFQALNDDDIAVGQDINDIFRWTESPPQSPGASPRRDSISQPGSPSMGLGRHSPFHHGGPNRGSGNLSMDTQDEPLQLLQQPLALGYYVSTARTGPLPKWFWSTCPQLQNICPVFLKSALLIHSPALQSNQDEFLHPNPHTRNYHPLDSTLTTDVLRYVLEGYNSLSWLSLDPSTHDRRSCLPVHIQVLMQLYQAVEALI